MSPIIQVVAYFLLFILTVYFFNYWKKQKTGDEIMAGEFTLFEIFFSFAMVGLSVGPIIYGTIMGNKVLEYELKSKLQSEEIVKVASSDAKIKELNKRNYEISEKLKSIEQLSIGEIKNIVERSKKLLDEYSVQFVLNETTLNKQVEILKSEKEQLDLQKQKLKEISSLSSEQINILTNGLTRDCKIESAKSFRNGIFFSIPIGVICSLIASYLLKSRNLEKSGEGNTT